MLGRTIALVAVAAAVAASGACEVEERVVRTSFGFEPGGDSGGGQQWDITESSSDAGRGGTWAIALGRFAGEDHEERAEAFAVQLRDFAGVEDVWVGPDGGGSMVYQGRFQSRNDPHGRAHLRRWREYVRSGQMRLPGLMMVPVGQRSGRVAGGEYDLEAQADRGRFTLQIGMYDEDYGDDFRDAAEQAVAALREDGWEAYYWHGPVRSTVAIGVFGDEVLDEGSPERDQMQAIRHHFPHNSLNGLTIREDRGDQVTEQPSTLVHIPGGRRG